MLFIILLRIALIVGVIVGGVWLITYMINSYKKTKLQVAEEKRRDKLFRFKYYEECYDDLSSIEKEDHASLMRDLGEVSRHKEREY